MSYRQKTISCMSQPLSHPSQSYCECSLCTGGMKTYFAHSTPYGRFLHSHAQVTLTCHPQSDIHPGIHPGSHSGPSCQVLNRRTKKCNQVQDHFYQLACHDASQSGGGFHSIKPDPHYTHYPMDLRRCTPTCTFTNTRITSRQCSRL